MSSPTYQSIKINSDAYGIAEAINKARGVPRSVTIEAALRRFEKLPRRHQDAAISEVVAERNGESPPSKVPTRLAS